MSLKLFHWRHNFSDIIDFYFLLCKDVFVRFIRNTINRYFCRNLFSLNVFKGFVSSIIISSLFSLSILQKYLLLLKLLQKCPSPAAPNGYFGEGPNSSIDCLMQGFQRHFRNISRIMDQGKKTHENLSAEQCGKIHLLGGIEKLKHWDIKNETRPSKIIR